MAWDIPPLPLAPDGMPWDGADEDDDGPGDEWQADRPAVLSILAGLVIGAW